MIKKYPKPEAIKEIIQHRKRLVKEISEKLREAYMSKQEYAVYYVESPGVIKNVTIAVKDKGMHSTVHKLFTKQYPQYTILSIEVIE